MSLITSRRKKFGVCIKVADIHELPFKKAEFDVVYAANILEHSVAPFVALVEWRRVLKPRGKLIVVMPSGEWLKEYYHFSVLTHSQMHDLLDKAGFKVLAGPQIKAKIPLRSGDIFYDLGRGWGHYDGYLAQKTVLPRQKFMLGRSKKETVKGNSLFQPIKSLLKTPYNLIRCYQARYHHE